MAPGESVLLEKVTSVAQIRENVRRYSDQFDANCDRALNLIHSTTYWVVDEDADQFGPSKFVGFANMTFQRYDSANEGNSIGEPFNGHVTHLAVAAVLGEYEADNRIAERLANWCTERVGPKAVAGINTSKWRFATLSSTRRYWAFLCNPEKFAGLEAAAVLDHMVWETDRGDPQPDDRILVWQAKGKGTHRGVIAVGEVTHSPEVMPSPIDEHPFWRQPISGPRNRTGFAVIRLSGLPLWEEDAGWLSELAVAKARGGTVFTVEPCQWHRVVREAAGAMRPDVVLQPQSTGQKYSSDPAIRRAVELHAQGIAENYFADKDFDVKDVSRNHPYDLHCKKEEEEVHVEVKGTTGAGNSVFLTRNEVLHARKHAERMALAIVRHIQVDKSGPHPVASGGEFQLIHPWNVDQGALSPLQFEYQLPSDT